MLLAQKQFSMDPRKGIEFVCISGLKNSDDYFHIQYLESNDASFKPYANTLTKSSVFKHEIGNVEFDARTVLLIDSTD